MTCIVAVADDKTVWMGGDSVSISGWDAYRNTDAKVWRKGEFLMGSSGDTRLSQLLRHAFTPPEITEGSLASYFAGPFTNALRECLKASGYAEKQNEKEKHEGYYLVGLRGRIFILWGDYSHIEPSWGYAAIGCGGGYAEGSMYATREDHGLDPRRRVQIALEAAERHSAGVRGPFTILRAE